MTFTKKLNTRNSKAIIREVEQMIEAGFPKVETYTVVGAKYGVSSRTVQRVMSGQKSDISNKKSDISNKKSDISNKTSDTLNKCYTSAEIVDNICKLGRTEDYVTAFEKVKSKYGSVVLSNGTDVLF